MLFVIFGLASAWVGVMVGCIRARVFDARARAREAEVARWNRMRRSARGEFHTDGGAW